jgi:hypothetical protein
MAELELFLSIGRLNIVMVETQWTDKNSVQF